MPRGAVILAPLLRVIQTPKMPLLLLIQGLLAVVSTIPLVLAIASVSYIDLMFFLLP
jgi:hypothetical protein